MIDDLNIKLKNTNIKIELTDDAKKYFIDNGYDYTFGARPLKRFLTKNLETLLSKKIIDGSIVNNDNLVIDVEDNNLCIKKR